ncbi:MAG: ABC transporter ATP-binding protein [Spirochaetales bacterium]|nr:ABC transporter ATP-binding protein [Spirochaetales bacterium]
MKSIRFHDVTKCFGDKRATDALSFSVEKGEIFGILGPNGAGKTTIIRQIMGLLAPDRGEIRVLGLDPQKEWKAMRRNVGLVPQESPHYPELSARCNLEFQASLYLPSLKGARARIQEILELVDLKARANDPVKTYSGGMKRRLAIGRALIHDPEIIFMDEPTLGVDVQGTHKIWDYIRMLAGTGKTILLATNVMSEADYLCGRVLIIDCGKKIASGSPEALKKTLGENEIIIGLEHETEETVIKQAVPVPFMKRGLTLTVRAAKGTEDLIGIIRRLPETLPVKSIELKKPSLDDVFLHYTGRSLRDTQ